MAPLTGVPTGTSAVPAHSPTLRERYALYRRSQGRELLNVIPREGMRALIRHFRDAGSDLAGDGELLDGLAERCAALLPLPPFQVWAEDFHRARAAYEEIPGPPLAPAAPDGSPVTVDVRHLPYEGAEWTAALEIRPRDDRWVGHLRFHSPACTRVFTTGDVFSEPSPVGLRDRFQGFDHHTLRAFLRSALP